MLGLCWTPTALHGMQKVATTVPSDPEQLLGAILVRKDIFHRFETTMHDTCLDANHLLEYLFSLYNSTAAPAEREVFPLPQSLGYLCRDVNYNKKASKRGHHVSPNSQPPQTVQQGSKLPDTAKGHQTLTTNGHKKKIKLEQSGFSGTLNYATQSTFPSKLYDSHPVFPGPSSSSVPDTKVEQLASEVDSCPVSSPLPPFGHSHHHGSRSHSPTSAQFSDALTTPPREDTAQNLTLDTGADSSGDAKIEAEDDVLGILGNQQKSKVVVGSSKRTKKGRPRGSTTESADADGEHVSRRKRTHQCFCGALFTRADNLKRHVRKCHEEKLEKLNPVPLDFITGSSSDPPADVTNDLPLSGQDGLESLQHDSLEPPQEETGHKQSNQQEEGQEPEQNEAVMKEGPGVRWSCFCGDSFSDHRQLVEHTRKHDEQT